MQKFLTNAAMPMVNIRRLAHMVGGFWLAALQRSHAVLVTRLRGGTVAPMPAIKPDSRYAVFNKRGATLAGVIALTIAAITPALAVPLSGSLWYNGDFDGDLGSSFQSSGVSRIYDNFIIPGADGSWNVSSVYSNNLWLTGTGLPPPTTANFEIRTGVSSGNGGVLVASGTGLPAIITPTGNNPTGFTELTVQIAGLSLTLAADQYWLVVSPVALGTYASATSGANAVGTPPGNDGNAFSNNINVNNFLPFGDEDFSMGVIGTKQQVAPPPGGTVPEPGTLALFAVGLLGAFAARRRTKRASLTPDASRLR